MAERPDSRLKRRTMLTMFRKPLEQSFPVVAPDTAEQELRALLDKAEQRQANSKSKKP